MTVVAHEQDEHNIWRVVMEFDDIVWNREVMKFLLNGFIAGYFVRKKCTIRIPNNVVARIHEISKV
jgi:hypothetical protein